MSSRSGPRVLVVGAGSIGSRHARNLLGLGAEVLVSDPDRERATAIDGANVHPGGLDDLDGFDGIVIATPTSLHGENVLHALASDARILVEKPLAATTDGLDELIARGAGRVMVGFNQRLHEPNARLVDIAHSGRAGRILAVRLWSGSYLPSWRPERDYRQVYSARAELGGGVLLDSIHELDLLIWILDERFDVVGAVVDRLGSLDIDVEDTVRALLRHKDGAVAEISLDYFSRGFRRGIEIIGEEATLRLDRAREVVEIEDEEDVEVQDASASASGSYETEAQVFLDWLRDAASPPVDVVVGAASVRLAEAIRQAALGEEARRESSAGQASP